MGWCRSRGRCADATTLIISTIWPLASCEHWLASTSQVGDLEKLGDITAQTEQTLAKIDKLLAQVAFTSTPHAHWLTGRLTGSLANIAGQR